jgi:hypothetical protein
MEEEGEYYYNNGNKFKGIINNKFEPVKGNMKYVNNDEYEGELDENGKRKGKGLMKYKNNEIYFGEWENDFKNGEGLFCSNYNDYQILINNIEMCKTNNIYNIFELKITNFFYKGEFRNDKMEGKGILYMINKNELFYNNTIFEGNFKDNHKFGYGCIYFKKNYIFECFWIDNNIIDIEKEGIFHLNNSIYFKNNFTYENWKVFIKKVTFGNIKKNPSMKKIKR